MRRLFLLAAALAVLAVPCLATLPTTVVTFNAARPDGSFPPTVRTAWAKVTQTSSNDPRVVGTVWPGTYSPATGKVTWTLPQSSEVMFNLPDYSIDQETYSLGTASTYLLNSLLAITPSTAPGWAGPLAPLLTVPAKGGMLASTGAAWSSISVGANGYVLKADSTATAGVSWASFAGLETDPRLAAHGTAGNVLTSTGSAWASTAPSWLPLAGGIMAGDLEFDGVHGIGTASGGNRPQYIFADSLFGADFTFANDITNPTLANVKVTSGATVPRQQTLADEDGTIYTSGMADGIIDASHIQNTPRDLGDADITVDLSNSNAGNVTHLDLDGQLKISGEPMLWSMPDADNYFLANAGNASATGSTSIGIGDGALAQAFSGDYNLAIGFGSLGQNVAGYNNLALMPGALASNIGGYSNLAAGFSALNANVSGNFNLALGDSALAALTSGSDCVAVGREAIRNATVTSDLVAVGSRALYGNTTGFGNVGIGSTALLTNSAGNGCTAVGDSALENVEGTGNTALGYIAGKLTSTGAGNSGSTYGTFIGNSAFPLGAAGTNETVIGYAAEGHGDNTVTLGNSSVTAAYVGTSQIAELDSTNTWTAAQSFDLGSIAVNTRCLTYGLNLINDTASAGGATVQDSPSLGYEHHVWDTDGSDDKWEWFIGPLGASAATTTSTLNFMSSKNDATAVYAGRLTSVGNFTSGAALIASTSVQTSAGSGAANGIGLASNTAGYMTFEGSSADGNEMDFGLGATVLTADRTITLPDDTGTVALTGTTTTQSFGGAIAATRHLIPFTFDATVQVGQIVEVDASHATCTGDCVSLAAASTDKPLGVYVGTQAGTAHATTEYTIAVGGKAYVAMSEDAADVALNDLLYATNTGADGYANASATVAGANHNAEIGHALYAEAKVVIISLNDGTDTFTLASSPGWAVGEPLVYWNSGDTTVTGLTDGGTYWVQSISGADVTLASSNGGAKLAVSGGTYTSGAYFQRLVKCVIHFN